MRPWVIGVIIAAAAAQTAPDFEAASVKISNSGAAATSIGYQGGSNRFRAVNEPLWRLIARRHGCKEGSRAQCPQALMGVDRAAALRYVPISG